MARRSFRWVVLIAGSQGAELILCDIGMPKMDGLELIGRLRQLPQHARTAAIALSGYGSAEDVNQALEAGFDAHIDKPVSLTLLLQTVADLCRARG